MPNANTGEVSFDPSQFKPVHTEAIEIPFDPADFKPIASKSNPAEVSFDPAEFKPTPSAAPTAPSPAQPSVWDRVTRVLTESPLAKSLGEFFDPSANRAAWESAGPQLRQRPEFALRHAPITSPEAWKAMFSIGGVKQLPSVANEAVNRAFGVVSDSPISPSAAMTPTEQRAHPIAAAAGDVAGGMASGGNIATLAATSGFGALGKAGTTLSRLVSGGFSLSQLWDAAKTSPEVLHAIKDGDVPRAQYLLAKMGLTVGLSYLGAKHATGKAEPQPLAETHPLPADEPVAQILHEQVPGVRITDSTAGKNHLVATDTIAEPKARTGWTDITPQAVNPQEVADTSRALGRPVSEAELPDIRRRLAAEENVKAGLAGNRRDTAGEIREAHRATLESKAGEPIRVYHGTTANIEDVSKLNTAFSRDGASGKGIYLSDNPRQASAYAGPAEQGTGGRVLAGLLDANAKLLDGNGPLPEPIRDALQNDHPDLDVTKPYLDILNDARAGKAGIEVTPDAVQATIENASDYDGVKYEHKYSDGVRKGIMLFQNSADLLKPTVPTARIVSDNHVPVVSHAEILTEAVQRVIDNSKELQKLGLDAEQIRSREDVPKMLNSVADKIKANLDPRVGVTIGFEAQKALARDLNIDVEDLLNRKSGATANAESAIAARALLKDSATRVMNVGRIAAMGDSDYQTKFAQALAQHQAVIEAVKGMAAEAGRALGSYRIKEADLPELKISDVFAKLSPDALTKAAQLLSKIDPNDTRQVNSFVEQIKPSSTADKVFEFYRNALLSSPKTVTVKAASEIAMMGLEATKKFVASGLSKDRFAAETWAYAKGAVQALKHTKDILSGKFDLADAPGFEGGGKQAIKGVTGKVIRFPSALIEKQTNLMYALNYFGELNAQAARAAIKEGHSGQALHARQEYLAANPTPKMMDAAHQTALHGTFQNELGKFGRSVHRAIQSDPTNISKFLFPFVRTPLNLVKASGEFSPYGLIKGLAKGDVDATSRGMIGSSIAAGIALLALEGHVTGGGPIDFKKKQTKEATGWQAYSLKIGNKYIAYRRFEPLGLAMGLVADAVHGIKTGDSEAVASSKADTAVAHIERNLSDLPFMYGLSSIMDALKDTTGKRIDNFIARQAGSFIPAGVANIAEGLDRTVRHPQGVTETLESRTPGLTGNVPPSLDITGRPLQRPVSALGGANPFPITTAKNDAVVGELARLGIATSLPPKEVKLGRTQVELSESEQLELARQEGQQLYDRLAGVLNEELWQSATDERKAAVIKRWRSDIARSRPFRLIGIRGPLENWLPEQASAAVN
jgi:ADP-Ribosyltransferase in polyvalent proteins